MNEEYGNDFVTLIDEDGNEVEFEHIDTCLLYTSFVISPSMAATVGLSASLRTRQRQFFPPMVAGVFMRASAPSESRSCRVVIAMRAGEAHTLLIALQPMASLCEVRRYR